MTSQTYAVLVLCTLAAALGCAVTWLLRDRYWLRRTGLLKQKFKQAFQQEQKDAYQSGWCWGMDQGEQIGYQRAIRDQQERERHAAQ